MSSVIGCLQISCFLIVSVISSTILLKTGNNYDDRIDAIGGWIVVQFLHIIGNCALVVFELHPQPSTLIGKYAALIAIICWKAVFILIEVVGMCYSFYIVHNPIELIPVRPRHPLFNENFNEVSTMAVTNPAFVIDQQNELAQGPISVISYPRSNSSALPLRDAVHQNNQIHHDSYNSLPHSRDSRLMENHVYNSRLCLDYANNLSPYEGLIDRSSDRLAYQMRPPRSLPPPYTPSINL